MRGPDTPPFGMCRRGERSVGSHGDAEMSAFPPLPRPLQPHYSSTLQSRGSNGSATIRFGGQGGPLHPMMVPMGGRGSELGGEHAPPFTPFRHATHPPPLQA